MAEQDLTEHMERIDIKDQQFLKEDLDQKVVENNFVQDLQYRVDLLRKEETLNKGFLQRVEISIKEDMMINLVISILNKSIHNNKRPLVEKIQVGLIMEK